MFVLLFIVGVLELLYSIDTNAKNVGNISTNPITQNIKNTDEKYKFREPFTLEEDELLKMIVNRYYMIYKICNKGFWMLVAEKMPRRDPKQYRERRRNYLSPDITNDEWTLKEYEKILELHRELGNKWDLIAKNLPGRNDVQIRNRHNWLQKNRNIAND